MKMMEYLSRAVHDGALDLFVIAGSRVSEKVEHEMRPVSEGVLQPKETSALIGELYEIAGRSIEYSQTNKKDNFSLSVPNLARFRVNIFRQRGSLAAVIKVIQFGIPDPKEMMIPDSVMNLADEKRGLILVTGLARSGKSVTQACLIERINQTRNAHIVTIENPIEFLFRNNKSIISQQEVFTDVENDMDALKDCLMMAPDVIFLSEMDDVDVMREAIKAAETGRLVITSLYSRNAVSAIEYIVQSFPDVQRDRVRLQLSLTLKAIVVQELLPGKEGGYLPAFDVVTVNSDIQRLIRENRVREIGAEAKSNGRNSTVTIDQCVLAYFSKELITRDVALNYSVDPESMRKKLRVIDPF